MKMMAPAITGRYSDELLAVAVSGDGQLLATGGEDRMICFWELPNGRALARWEANDAEITALTFLADRRTLISGAADGLIKVWDLSSIRSELEAIDLDWRGRSVLARPSAP